MWQLVNKLIQPCLSPSGLVHECLRNLEKETYLQVLETLPATPSRESSLVHLSSLSCFLYWGEGLLNQWSERVEFGDSWYSQKWGQGHLEWQSYCGCLLGANCSVIAGGDYQVLHL